MIAHEELVAHVALQDRLDDAVAHTAEQREPEVFGNINAERFPWLLESWDYDSDKQIIKAKFEQRFTGGDYDSHYVSIPLNELKEE